MTEATSTITEGTVITFPSFDRRTTKVCRRIGIVRWVNRDSYAGEGTVTVYSPENGRTYCLSSTEDIRVLPRVAPEWVAAYTD